MIHSILLVQNMCLAIYLHNLFPCPLWSTSSSGALHLIFHIFLHPIVSSFCPYHRNLFCCSINITQLLTWNSILYLNITHPSNHSHLCLLKCHLIFFPDRPGLTSMWHTTLHTTAIQPPSPITTILRPFIGDHSREAVPEENFCALWCKGRLTETDTPTIRLGATPSGLISAHLHHPSFFTGQMPFQLPNQQC